MSSTESKARPSRWRARTLALLLGLALTPLLLEGALRLAALWLVEGARTGVAGEAAILCQGDSFTFGLFLPPEAAYPARLEELLQTHGSPGARVVNAGIPSKPTWIVKQELRADLRRWKPRIVLLLAGINDRWRLRPEDHAVETRGPAPRPWRIVSAWQWLSHRLRSSQADDELAADEDGATAAPAAAVDEPIAGVDDQGITNWIPTTAVKSRPGVQEVRFRDRHGAARGFDILAGSPSDEEFCAWIEEDLTTAVAIAREEGVVPVLLAYPARGGHFDPTNAALERVAKRTRTLFVDPRPEFSLGVQRAGQAALYFPDSHATDAGSALLARVVLRELADAGLVQLDAVPAPLAVLDGWQAPVLAVAVDAAARGARPGRVRVEYGSGFGAVLFLSRARGETQVDFPTLGDVKRVAVARPTTRTLPLAHDELLAASLRGNQFRTVTLGADGTAFLPIPWDLVDASGAGGPILATVAIVLPKVGPVIAVSEVLDFGSEKQ